jgi:hypothetical protein
LVLDVVPTDGAILGFTNCWHEHAVESAALVELVRPGTLARLTIRVITASSFVASKIESYRSRGKGDLYHADIEDIVTVIDGRPSLLSEIEAERDDLRQYVRTQMKRLLEEGLEDKVAAHLFPDAASQVRALSVIAKCRHIAGDTSKPARPEAIPTSTVLWTIHVLEGVPDSLYVNCWLEPRIRSFEPFFNGNQAALPLASLTDALRQAVAILWGGTQPTIENHPDVDRTRAYRRANDHVSRAARPTGLSVLPATLRWQREVHVPNGVIAGPGADINVTTTLRGSIRALDIEADRIASARVSDAVAAKAAWDR